MNRRNYGDSLVNKEAVVSCFQEPCDFSRGRFRITTIAKDYGKSGQWMNETLHELGIQYKQGKIWLLYQKHAEQGYTSTKTSIYDGTDGEKHTSVHTYWTQKGRLFIYDTLKANGILPLIECSED